MDSGFQGITIQHHLRRQFCTARELRGMNTGLGHTQQTFCIVCVTASGVQHRRVTTVFRFIVKTSYGKPDQWIDPVESGNKPRQQHGEPVQTLDMTEFMQ